jgi:sugar O-acyltransferase (sialic acid O-acetyltransferase NeuD family)
MDESVFDQKRERPAVINRKMTPSARRVARENNISEELLATLQKEVIEEKDILSLLGSGKVYIYGASTGCKQIIEILISSNKYQILGIIDDNKEFHGKKIGAYEVLGGFEWLKKRYTEKPDFGIMISSHSTNREKIFNMIKKDMPGLELPPIIDSRAIILSGVKIGESSLIEPGVILGHEVEIGKNVILNLGAKISHNSIVGDHTHVALGVSMSAAVVVGRNVFIGAGAAINPAVSIGENSIISPASAVLHDIPANVIVNGVPGKIVGESKRGKQ